MDATQLNILLKWPLDLFTKAFQGGIIINAQGCTI